MTFSPFPSLLAQQHDTRQTAAASPPQDNVPAFESAQAIAIVERNLGGPIGAHFESFDPEPIAAASLGQVWL